MVYVYGCRACAHEQEESHSMKDTPTIACKSCGSTDTYRVIQEVSFAIRGAGVHRPGLSLNRSPKERRGR